MNTLCTCSYTLSGRIHRVGHNIGHAMFYMENEKHLPCDLFTVHQSKSRMLKQKEFMEENLCTNLKYNSGVQFVCKQIITPRVHNAYYKLSLLITTFDLLRNMILSIGFALRSAMICVGI